LKIKSKLESHLQSLPERLQVPVAHQLDRLFEDSDSVAWLDRAEPELLASICKVWACSEFVSRYCVTHSDVFKDLVESGDLQRAYASGELPAKISHLLQTVDDQPQLNVVIRYARQREMVRIAWRDISGWAQLSETLEDLSQLADTCVALALEKLQHWLEQSFGQPSDSKGRTQQLVVLAMGKLGAHELNFSSDVDLIFAYPHSGQTLNGPKSISNEEFFTRLGRQFITVLDQVTAEGFVFAYGRLVKAVPWLPVLTRLKVITKFTAGSGSDMP
jgi:glutamate-ammonia-ligase adenylyltransferase